MFVEALALQGVIAVARDLAGGRRRPVIQSEFREAAWAAELRDRRRIERSAYLDRIGILASFPAGLLPVEEGSTVTLTPMLMVVTEDDLVLMTSEIGEDVETEFARIARSEVGTVEVLDADGAPVSGRIPDFAEELEGGGAAGPFVLEVDLVDGTELGLVFRSASVAAEAVARLRSFLPAER